MKPGTAASLSIQILFLVFLLGVWFSATRWWGVPVILVPPPSLVFTQFLHLMFSGAFLAPLRVTLFEVVSAFLLAASLGLSAGYAVAGSTYRMLVFEPLLTALYAIPAILFFPLYALLFGLGTGSKIALGATISFFPIVLNTVAGFKASDAVYVKVARSLGASRSHMFRFVLLPAAFPMVLVGLRMGLILSFLSVLGSETIASFAGLGHETMQNSETMDSGAMYAFIVFVILLAAVLNVTLNAIGRRWGPMDTENEP